MTNIFQKCLSTKKTEDKTQMVLNVQASYIGKNLFVNTTTISIPYIHHANHVHEKDAYNGNIIGKWHLVGHKWCCYDWKDFPYYFKKNIDDLVYSYCKVNRHSYDFHCLNDLLVNTTTISIPYIYHMDHKHGTMSTSAIVLVNDTSVAYKKTKKQKAGRKYDYIGRWCCNY